MLQLGLYFLGVLIVAGAPFVAVLGIARRLSDRPPRIVRDIGTVLGFGATATALMVTSPNLGLSNGAAIWLSTGLASLWSVEALLRLTGRWWVAASGVPISAGAVWSFFAIEARTHGPWYIQSEALAILASVAGAALAWHVVMFILLAAWAPLVGRREHRAEDGRCTHCGYDLSGVTGGRCPECGRDVARGGDHMDKAAALATAETTRPRSSPGSRAS